MSGGLSTATQAVAQTLAESAAFRTLVGALNVAEALAKIHFRYLPPSATLPFGWTRDELIALRPFALIYVDQFSYEEVPGSWKEIGFWIIQIEKNVTGAAVSEGNMPTIAERLSFGDTISTILTEMRENIDEQREGCLARAFRVGFAPPADLPSPDFVYYNSPEDEKTDGPWIASNLGVILI